MIIKEPLLKYFPPYLKLLSLGILILICLLFTLLIGILTAIPFFGTGVLENITSIDYSNPETVSLLKYMQIINQLGLFILPPVIFAFLVNRNISGYLKLNQKPKLLSIIIGTLIIFAAMPFLHWLSNINEMIKFPEFLSWLENWMIESEKQAAKLTETFLNVNTFNGFLFNILMIAIIPGIGEELLFRGVLLRLFKEWTKNIHWAVFISAVLFSAFHLQFYGFSPRLMLGILLGYMFVWTGSIWVPIFIHFINNAAAVIFVYIVNKNKLETNLESFGATDNLWLIIGSFLIVAVLLNVIYKKRGNIQNDISSH